MLKKASNAKGRSDGLLRAMPLHIWRDFAKAAVPIQLRPKEVLFHAGDKGDSCYLLRSGAVKASVIARDGQERLLAILGSGAMIGELALVDELPRSATVTALRHCKLMHMTKAAFFHLADRNPAIYRQALRLMAKRLRGTNDSVVAQGTVTVAGRVARAFNSLAEGLGDHQANGRIILSQRITQNDIAGMAGVARENASRAINDLLRAGVLGRVQGFYAIENAETLRSMAEI